MVHGSTPLLYAVFTGLAQFAGALGNGPRQALGEEVELPRLKRKAALNFESSLGGGGSLMPKKALVDLRPSLVAEKTVKEKLLIKHPLNVSEHSVKENLLKEKESFFQKVPLEESSAQELSQDLSGFSQDLLGLSQNCDSLNPLQDDSHSGFPESLGQVSLFKGEVLHKESALKGGSHSGVLRRDGVEKADARKFKQSMQNSHKSSSLSSHKTSSLSSHKSSTGSSHKSNTGSSHKSSSMSSHKSSSQSLQKVKCSQELSLPNFGSSQMSNTQSSNTQMSNTQSSNTQRSNTQRSNTQRSSTQSQKSSTQMSSSKVSSSQGSQLSDSQAYRIPRLQSTLGEDDLARKTAFLMGSFAKSVMEGGAAMLREYLDATNKGSNSG